MNINGSYSTTRSSLYIDQLSKLLFDKATMEKIGQGFFQCDTTYNLAGTDDGAAPIQRRGTVLDETLSYNLQKFSRMMMASASGVNDVDPGNAEGDAFQAQAAYTKNGNGNPQSNNHSVFITVVEPLFCSVFSPISVMRPSQMNPEMMYSRFSNCLPLCDTISVECQWHSQSLADNLLW